MHRHGPSCLEGPLSWKRGRRRPDASPDTTSPPSANRGAGKMTDNESAPRNPERPIRWQLVERVRREIEAGSYDTPEKMEIALDRLLKRLEID